MIKLKTLIFEANKIANGTTFTLSNRDPWEYKNLDGTWYTKLKSKNSWLNMKSSLSTANYNDAIKLLINKSSGITIDTPVEKKKDDQKSTTKSDKSSKSTTKSDKSSKSTTKSDKSSKSTTKSDKSSKSTNIIIGDSQTGLVSKNSSTVQLIDELQEKGKGVSWLRDQVAVYPVSPNVKNVVLCIGTNGGYSSNGSAEKGLFTALNKTFPTAKIYAVQGSWGWGSYLKKPVTEKQVRTYYKNYYQDKGAILIEPPIGYGDPHSNKPVYKDIGAAIDFELN